MNRRKVIKEKVSDITIGNVEEVPSNNVFIIVLKNILDKDKNNNFLRT